MEQKIEVVKAAILLSSQSGAHKEAESKADFFCGS